MVALKRWFHSFLQTTGDLTGRISSRHLWFFCFVYLKWSEISEHSQYLAAFWYFLFTAEEHTHSSHPPLKRKQDKTTAKTPPWCDQTSSCSSQACHGWLQHTDRNPAPKNHRKRCNWWEVTGERLQEWTEREEKRPHGSKPQQNTGFVTSSLFQVDLLPQ